jgi:hypothetical protein
MDIPDIRPIFDHDLTNGVPIDMPREGKLNDLRQLNGASAGLRLQFSQIWWVSWHSLKLLPYMDLSTQEINLLELKAKDLASAKAASRRKIGDRRISFRYRVDETVNLLRIRNEKFTVSDFRKTDSCAW